MTIDFAGHSCLLLPEGAALIKQTLFVADLHLGKGAAFRDQGLAVPTGSTTTTLNRLVTLAQSHDADQIIVLGDIFHSPKAAQSTDEQFQQTILNHPELKWSAVPGNHDRKIKLLDCCPSLEILTPATPFQEIHLHHHPPEDVTIPSLSGHLHPVCSLPVAKTLKRCRAFWLRQQRLILPAFGEFTGGCRVDPDPEDNLYLILANKVIKAPKTK